MVNYTAHFVSNTSSKMINERRTIDNCIASEGLIMAVFFTFFALPVHLLMMKILYKDCEMALPRHKIMMSLTISDALQIFIITVLKTFQQIISATRYHEAACRYMQTIKIFSVTVTLFVSSLSIVSLSIERYITCIYSLHVYYIMTTRRVTVAIGIQWIIGIGIGVITACLHDTGETPEILTEPEILQRASMFIIFPSATVITLIQLRLFLFSRSKLARVRPVHAFGNQAEMADFRRRQLKTTFIASIVATAYIVCMFPVAIAYAYGWSHGKIIDHPLKPVCAFLALLNTLVDPFIYGLGIGETRRLMWKNIKEVKNFLLWHLFKVPSFN